MTPTLAIRRRGYSVHPWRIGLAHADGHFQELAHFSFPRKRDAVPFLARLQALALDWTVPVAQWPQTQRLAVLAILTDTPDWQADEELRAHGLVAPGRR